MQEEAQEEQLQIQAEEESSILVPLTATPTDIQAKYYDRKYYLLITVIFIFSAVTLTLLILLLPQHDTICDFPYPKTYICYKTNSSINIDGQLNEEAWNEVPWSDYFVDISGPSFPIPRFATRIKLRYDNEYLYIGAYLEETQIWANQTSSIDKQIYLDNAFETFIDVDGTNHNYTQTDVNAINVASVLHINKPYENGGEASTMIVPTKKTAVFIDGEVNNPSASSKYWTIEMALPILDLLSFSKRDNVRDGDLWRINFNRVEWKVVVEDHTFHKVANWCISFNCTPGGIPEDNWVWSPQYDVNMHEPEKWGFLQFSNGSVNSSDVIIDKIWKVRGVLMKIYYAERDYYLKHNIYTDNFNNLDIDSSLTRGWCTNIPKISVSENQTKYQVDIITGYKVGHLTDDRKLWFTKFK